MKLLVLLLLAGCGDHVWINLVDATDTREADDHVVVTAVVQCEAVGLGKSDCAASSEYCVEARWVDADTTIDTARTCKTDVLGGGARANLVVRSTKPIPKTGVIDIRLALAATGAPAGRNDFEVRAGKPLRSP